jgi:hypothetical protein
MRMVGLRVVALGAVLGAPLSSGAKEKTEQKPKGEVVVFGFGWSGALGADVTYRWTRTSTGKPAQGVTVVGRLHVAAEGDGLRVEYGDWKREAAGSAAAAAPPVSPQKLANIVDKRGGLLRVDGEAPALAKANAARTWQMLVGSWAGAQLEVGKEYVQTLEGPVPLVPGGKLRSTVRFRAERLLDCPGNPALECVEVKLHSEPDRKSLAKLTSALSAQSGKKIDVKDAEDADVGGVEEATLVTEPARLIPHRLVVTKTVELRPAAGEPRSQVDRTTWTFDYPAAAKAP